MIHRALWALLLAASAPSEGREVLTVEKAIELARANHPSLRQARADVAAADGRRVQARSPLLPQLNAALSYTRGTGNKVPKIGEALPTDPSSLSTYDFYAGSIVASQLIYDFGRSIGAWRSAVAQVREQEASERTTNHDVVFNVAGAYFAAGALRELVQVAKETLDNQERHLVQIERFVKAGARPEIDLAQARADRAQADVQFIQAENAYEVSKAQLNLAMGVERSTDYDVGGEGSFAEPMPEESRTIDQLLADAYGARPELAQIASEIDSRMRLIDAASGGYYPSLLASTGLTSAGPRVDQLTGNWNAQLVLAWPIFEGLNTVGRVDETEAALASIGAQKESLKQAIRLDVQQAQIEVRGAKATLAAADETLKNVKERWRLAEGRYKAGTGNIIELSDAQVALTMASAQQVRAKYDLARSRAHLFHALGRM